MIPQLECYELGDQRYNTQIKRFAVPLRNSMTKDRIRRQRWSGASHCCIDSSIVGTMSNSTTVANHAYRFLVLPTQIISKPQVNSPWRSKLENNRSSAQHPDSIIVQVRLIITTHTTICIYFEKLAKCLKTCNQPRSSNKCLDCPPCAKAGNDSHTASDSTSIGS